MNTATTGALLAHDQIDRYRSFGAFGNPVYQSHVQLRAMLKTKRGDRYADYFAKPSLDPDTGELRWTAMRPGVARGWHEMTPEEQAERALDLEVLRSGLIGFVQELRAQGGQQPGGAAAFASLLEQAMKVPAQGQFLYFVGDQPVIAFWGFEDRNGASVDPAAVAPRFATAGPAAAAALPVAAAAAPRRAWWWWLLWLLLALLLLALLAWLLPRSCTAGLPLGLGGLAPGDAASAPPLGRASDPAADPQAAPRPGLDGPGGPGAAGGLPGGQGGLEPPLPGASGPATDAPPTGRDTPPGAAEPPLQPPSQPLAPADALPDPARTEPPAVPDAKPDDKPASAPDRAATDPPLPPQDPKAMQLPPDGANAAKGMGFLEGQWKAGEGLFDRQTQQPLDLSLNFGKDGKGELALRRPDGTVCRGPVQGRMTGGKLGIDGSQAIPCSNGSSYGAPKIECQKERDGQTQCYGVNRDGSRYYMGMQRR